MQSNLKIKNTTVSAGKKMVKRSNTHTKKTNKNTHYTSCILLHQGVCLSVNFSKIQNASDGLDKKKERKKAITSLRSEQ